VHSLSWKLGGALLLMVVVSVGLMAYITNLSTTREFRQYVSQGSMMYVHTVGNSLSQFYAQRDSWADVQDTLDNLLRSDNDRLIVSDSSHIIVGDTARDWLGRTVKEVGMVSGTSIILSGQEVGKLYVMSSGTGPGMGRHMGGRGSPVSPMLDVAEQNFLDRVNSSLWIAGLIAIAVALLLGLVLTRQITRPIHALSKGASQVAKGNLDYRVNISSKDELGHLAQSFNTMASSLDRSEQSRQRLLADITHELRTPLTIIEGTVDGILDGVFAPDHEHLESIKEQTTFLTRLIGDLRDLSLVEAGQLKIELVSTNIVDLVSRKLSQAEVKAREKNIQLKINVDHALPEVNVDPTRIEQVVVNLLANAIRHTPADGSVTVSMKAVYSDTTQPVEKTSVIISIADTGEGIAPEHLPHIFDRFYRVKDSRARSEGGAGLGLTIVKQMIETHGGKVWVESEPNKGSTFYMAIPVSEQ